ncbi:unnamed protein product [Sphagnum troendelagicum]|jgi:hypothetical protein
MARDLKRTYGGGSGSGNNMGGSCAAASVLPSMHYLARNGEMGGLAAKGSPSDHDITAATHGLLQQLPFPSSSNNVKVERSSSPAAAVYESTGLYHPSFHTGRAGAQAQQAATEAAAHEAQSGCGLTENSALINNGSNSSQNGGSGSETVDKGGGGGVNPQRSAEDWWDSWAAPPAPTSAAAAAAAVAEFGTFKAAGGGGYGNFDELDSIMLMLPAPAPDQTLMRYLMGESQQSHQQGLQAALQQGGGGVLRMKDMDAVMIEQDSWSSNHEQQQQQQSAQSEISHPHGSGGGDASFSGISPSSAPSCVVGVIPTSAEPTSAFLTPSFPPSLPRALSLPSHMRNITLNSGGEQHHHHHRPNSEVSVAGVSINMRSMNGPSGGYPFPAAPTSSSSMAAAASYSDSPDSSSSVPGDFFRQTLFSNSSGFQALQTPQENNSFVALQASMGMKEVPPPHPIRGGQTSPSSNQAFRLNHHHHHPPPSLGQGSSCFYQDSRDIATTTTPPHRNLQRSFTSLPSLSSMDQQMKQLQGMGVNRDYLLQRQKSWQPGRRSPSRHFISDHQHHHHHHQPHAPNQNTPGDWKLDMSRMQTVRTTSLSPAAPVQGGFTFSSPKLESSFKGEEKKEGLVNPPDTGQQQQQEGGVIPEGGLDMVTYLLKAAEAAEVGNTEVAKAILARLNQHISPARGKPFHRVAYYFQQALLTHMMGAENFTEKLLPDRNLPPLEEYHKINAYVHFCEVSPVPKFAHFTANQAIMEAMEGENSVHVIDFRLGAGAQWASFLQDIASMQAAGKLTPRVRLTAVGPNSDEMNATGANLSAFAQSLNISLEFQAVVTSCQQLLELSMLNLRDQEAIAVNFVFSLHRLLDDTFSNGLSAVLKTVRDAKPKVITVVEQEANHNGSNFQERFYEAFQYYLFLFDSLTSSLEPGSDSSLVNTSIESYLLAPEILNIVAAEGASRVERHERLEQWRIRMCTAGFQSRPLSDASHFQADKLLSERSPRRGGFQVARDNGCLLLGWQGRPLLAASSWTC